MGTIQSRTSERLRRATMQEWRREQRRCYLCGGDIAWDQPKLVQNPRSATLDHIQPQALNPHLADDPNNWAPSHFACNRAKGAYLTVEQFGKAFSDPADVQRILFPQGVTERVVEPKPKPGRPVRTTPPAFA